MLAGMTRLKEAMGKHFYLPKLDERTRVLVGQCDPCQNKYKSGGKAYGDLPPRHAIVAPWPEIHIDLIAWTLELQRSRRYSLV
jgi:hypothetical protein